MSSIFLDKIKNLKPASTRKLSRRNKIITKSRSIEDIGLSNSFYVSRNSIGENRDK